MKLRFPMPEPLKGHVKAKLKNVFCLLSLNWRAYDFHRVIFCVNISAYMFYKLK